jgi:hypothetical protein
MKFIKLLLLACLFIVTLQRVTKKSEKSNLKAKFNKKTKSKSTTSTLVNTEALTRDVTVKSYGGSLEVNGGDGVTLYLRAGEINYSQTKGLPFRTDNNQDISKGLTSYFVKYGTGLYYIPYRAMSSVSFDSPWAGHDYTTYTTRGSTHKFFYWYDSWDNGSGYDLRSVINTARTLRLTQIRTILSNLNTYAANYVTSKQNYDAANGKLPGIENQITVTTKSLNDANTQRATDFTAADAFAPKIRDEENNLAVLIKSKEALNTENLNKNSMIGSLNSNNDDLTQQKTSGTVNANGFKSNVDSFTSDLNTNIATLAIEIVTDANLANAAKDAILTKQDLDTFMKNINEILP